MVRTTVLVAGVLLATWEICAAQAPVTPIPESMTIGRFTFIDVGPPFDFYEVIRVKEQGSGLAIERALVTPLGPACGPLASVETSSGSLRESISELLGSKSPCAIPEKELNHELERCKHCLTFSGMNVTMQVSCGGKLRQLRMDILDRDLFDPKQKTPDNTSWTMGVLGELDKALGPGVWDKPMFTTGDAKKEPANDTELVEEIRDAKYDALFDTGRLISQIALDAEKAPPPPPSVEIENVSPIAPVSPKMPTYPPIAKAARVEGVVNVAFDISPEGKVVNIAVIDGPKLLQLGVTDGLSGWRFLQSVWGSSGRASIRFRRNCTAGPASPSH